MIELDVPLNPRPDLHLEWCEAALDDAIFMETDMPPGTVFVAGGYTLETIEEAVPGCPVMCRIIQNNRQRAIELIGKYADVPEPKPKSRLKEFTEYILRRLNRS